MKKLLSIAALLCASFAAHADNAAQDLVLKCVNGTVGASVAPWVSNCPTANQVFAVPVDTDIVATDSKAGTWQRYGDIASTRLVRACLKGSAFTGASCTGDGLTSGAVFKAKSALVGSGGATAPPAIDTGAKLTWAAPTTNVDNTPLTDLSGFYVYQGTSSDVSKQVKLATSLTKADTTYAITGLAPGTWYWSMTAFNSVGMESEHTPSVSKTIAAPPTKPSSFTMSVQ